MLTFDWFASLRDRQVRDREKLFLAEGLRFLHRAVEHKAEIVGLCLCPELYAGRHMDDFICDLPFPKRYLSRSRFIDLTSDVEPQGVIIAVRQRWTPLIQVEAAPNDLHLVLDGVRSPGNLGTILRTCEAVGVNSVWMVGGEVDVHDPGCIRASMGSIFSQRLVRTSSKAIEGWKRRRTCRFVGTSPYAEADFREISTRDPVAIVMGSERKGMSPRQTALCDQVVRIPMVGPLDSLNLAVATSLTLYEVWRGRNPVAANSLGCR